MPAARAMALPGFFRPSRNRFVFDTSSRRRRPGRSGVRRPEAPNPLWFAVQAPTNLGTISAPFFAPSQDGFVVYQPLTTMNCTSGTNRTLAPPWTLAFGPWTLDLGPWTFPHLSGPIRNFRFFSGPIPYDSATNDSADSGSAVFPLTVTAGR